VRSHLTADHTLHAPELLGVELVSVLRRLVRTGQLHEAEALTALDTFAALGIETYEHQPFLPRCLELRDSLTAYDALYVSLAEALHAPLLTCDAKLARSTGHAAKVQHIG
jgi:predicted nucleic acid-binding protein